MKKASDLLAFFVSAWVKGDSLREWSIASLLFRGGK
jgi:hypothetical protein